MVLSDLAEFVNFVTRVKIVPATADNVAFGETERAARARFRRETVDARAVADVADAAQGHHRSAGRDAAAAAAEMVLVRIAYVADLPTPDEAIRMIEQNGGAIAGVGGNAAPRSAPAAPVSSVHVVAGARARPRRAPVPRRRRARR